jgi:hypothetical protein
MPRSLLKTAAILIVGILTSVVGGMELDAIMQPKDFDVELHKALTTSPQSREWPEIMRKLHQAADITVYISDPLAGLVVGIFVGFFQRRCTALVALSCMVPNFLLSLFSDNVKNWAGSPPGLLLYLGRNSLPFIAAVAGAAFVQWLFLRRPSSARKAQEA